MYCIYFHFIGVGETEELAKSAAAFKLLRRLRNQTNVDGEP